MSPGYRKTCESHDEVLVRDFFLVNDLLRFKSEAEAADFITRRLDELFG
jgi:hypothetical protein